LGRDPGYVGAVNPDIDEPVELAEYDPRWPDWFATDAVEIQRQLASNVLQLEHFGSTAVPRALAKPIIDILVALRDWPPAKRDLDALEELGYRSFGEAGVPGRWYLIRRAAHATNLSIAQPNGALWINNLALRDYLRSHPDAAEEYGRAKQRALADGACTLIPYSAAKAAELHALLDAARLWRP
jgi:GrpB-like predicted nucleotidyltransferase (UPF0157 family)